MRQALTRIAKALEGTSFAGKAYLVGGAVRDDLLGRRVDHDLDIVIEGDALAVAELLRERGVAKSVPVVYPRFGTAMVHIGSATVELVTARRESYDEESRKPHVEPASLAEDAARRDFTVNTLMRSLTTGELVDPLGRGLDDLRSKTLRTPVDPVATFHDDPLRMLRAVRFRWQLGFDYAEGLAEAVRNQAHRLSVISAERIKEEFAKILVLEQADKGMQDLLDLDLLAVFAPEFLPMAGCVQGGYHHLDVWGHTLLALRNAGPGDLVLNLAVLFHDIGKPSTKTVDERGQTRFFRHEVVGAEIALDVLRRLKFSKDESENVALLVRNHMRLNSMDSISPSAARRIIHDLGDNVGRWLDLIEADSKSLKPGVTKLDVDRVRRLLDETASATPQQELHSPLTGEEIMEATGLPPGPLLGTLKKMLLEDVLEGRIMTGDKTAGKVRLMEHWRNVEASRGVAQVTEEADDRD